MYTEDKIQFKFDLFLEHKIYEFWFIYELF